MNTILNLGLTDASVQGLARKTRNPRFAYDGYRRLIDMFGSTAMGIEHVGLGADFVDQVVSLGQSPDGKSSLGIEGFTRPDEYPAAVSALQARGYVGDHLEAIKSGNWLRVPPRRMARSSACFPGRLTDRWRASWRRRRRRLPQLRERPMHAKVSRRLSKNGSRYLPGDDPASCGIS
jgi:hypothetical protein